jgi:hypothetical protein
VGMILSMSGGRGWTWDYYHAETFIRGRKKDKLLRLFVFLFLFESFEFDSLFLQRVFVLGRV